MSTCLKPLDKTTCHALGTGSLSEQQARDLFRQGEEAVVFALLELTKQLVEAQGKANPSITPSTPSGMPLARVVATCKNPPAKGRGKKRPGGKSGHPLLAPRGARASRLGRRTSAKRCPDCNGRLKRCSETRTRYIEDIPAL